MTDSKKMSRPPPKVTSWDIVRVLVGGLLLVSATLKLNSLLTQSLVTSNEWLASPRVQWLAVGWESALALWLFSGYRANISRWAAFATFGIFAAISLHEAAAGKRTCCCFGAVQAQPWLVFAMDLGIVAFLYLVHVITSTLPTIAPFARTATMLLAVLSLATGVTAASWYTPKTSTLQILDWPDTPLVVERGSHIEWRFRLHNPNSQPMVIGNVATSCDCLTVDFVERTVPSGATVFGRAILDFSREVDFRGELHLIAAGTQAGTKESVPAFVLVRSVSVP